MKSELWNCSTTKSTEEISNGERVVKLLYILESTEEISNGEWVVKLLYITVFYGERELESFNMVISRMKKTIYT